MLCAEKNYVVKSCPMFYFSTKIDNFQRFFFT